MSSRIVNPVSKLAFASARPITTTAQVARPSHLLRPASKAPHQLRRTGQTEDAAASVSETSRPLTTVSVSTPRRPLSAAQTRLAPMQGFRFTATASCPPQQQQHTGSAARRVDCVVLPNLSPPQRSDGDMANFARMIYIPAMGAAPVVDAIAAIDASSSSSFSLSSSSSAATAATSTEEQSLANAGEAAAETVFVAAANPSAVAPMTEIEGIGADGLELFASGEAKHQQRRTGEEDETIRGLWAGLMDDVLGGASRGGGVGTRAA